LDTETGGQKSTRAAVIVGRDRELKNRRQECRQKRPVSDRRRFPQFGKTGWCRATPRRSRGMEPTVRNSRIKSAIGLEAARCSPLSRRFPERRLVSCRPKFSRGNGIFGCRDRRPRIHPERPLLSAETGNVENRRQDPRRNGLFSIDDRFRGSGRLDGRTPSEYIFRQKILMDIRIAPLAWTPSC
jgi:hypothetical protein